MDHESLLGSVHVIDSDHPKPIEVDPELENWFTYHTPTPDQLPKYKAIRDAAKLFAGEIKSSVPSCADRSAALRKVREAVMTANAAIACGGK